MDKFEKDIETSEYQEDKFLKKLKLVRNEFKTVGKYGMPIIKKQEIDLDKFGGEGIELKNNYRKKIENPYSEQELFDLKNACSLLPRILSVDINNYNGAITVKCDKTNKIEWYDENGLIKTKYNFGRNFTNTLSIKGLDYKEVYFKLTGEYGETQSKLFQLTGWE